MSGLAEPAPPPRVSELFEDVQVPGITYHEMEVAKATPQSPLKASRFTIDPGSGTPEDQHAVHELWFIAQGTLDVHYDGVRHTVTGGNVLYFTPWKKHYSRNTGTERVMVFSVWWP